MLPFMNPKKLSSVVVMKTKPEGGAEASHEEGEHPPELMNFMEDLIQAVHAKDPSAAAEAFQAACHFMKAGESVEGEV